MANNIVNILRTGIEKDRSQKLNVNRNLNFSVRHVKILSSLANDCNLQNVECNFLDMKRYSLRPQNLLIRIVW